MRGILVALALCCGAAPAWAQAPAPETPEAVDPAREHYKRGVTHFELGEFDRAIDEFKAAYAISKQSSLLFNLAQAARAGGRFEDALHFYRMYLRAEPGTTERAFVETRMAELEKDIADRDAKAAARAPGVVVREGGAQKLKITGLVTLGSGLALAGVGSYFAIRADDAEEELDNLYRRGGMWNDKYHDLYQRGQRDQLTAGIFLGAGAVAIVTGGVLTYLGFTSETRTMTLSPRSGGAVVGWSCAF